MYLDFPVDGDGVEVTFSNMLDSAHIDFNESECGSLGGEDYMTIGKVAKYEISYHIRLWVEHKKTF